VNPGTPPHNPETPVRPGGEGGGEGQNPAQPTLPQTGVVAGLAGLTVLGGSALLGSGLALAAKKKKAAQTQSIEEFANQKYDDEYNEIFGAEQ